MAFDPAVIAAFESGDIGKRIFLVEFRLDSGTLYYTTAPEDKIYDGNTYIPLGPIGSVGVVKETDQIEPADYQVLIGGVGSAILATFLGEPTLNRTCVCYQGLMNDDQSIIGDYWIYFEGLMQPPFINDGDNPLVQINVKDILADWDRNIESRYTDAEQRRLHPDDYCLEFVSSLAGKEIRWPLAPWFEKNA